jgi:hypothetical protein
MVSKSSTRLVYSFIQYSSLMLFLAFSVKADSEILKPNYDVPEHKLKLFTIRSSLMLSCNVTAPNSEKLKLEWKYNGENVTKVFHGRHQIINAERRFILDRPEEADIGLYECHIPELRASAQFTVIAAPMAKLPKNTPVVEGEKLTITCVAIGTDPVFYWGVGNITYKDSEDRVILSKDEHGHENAVLSYEIADLNDRGNFTCFVKNNLTYLVDSVEPISAVTYVRVKGKMAALWPFIGIVAEVFVLCAIILIYEKRRNKQEPEESDTDSPEIKNDHHGKDSEVRHRK